jgi:hypothetical protein
MRGVKRKEKNERPQIICLVFLCACVQERAWLTLSYPPLKHTSTPSLSLSLFQYPLPKAVSLFLSFPHILLNSLVSSFLSLLTTIYYYAQQQYHYTNFNSRIPSLLATLSSPFSLPCKGCFFLVQLTGYAYYSLYESFLSLSLY